MSSSKPHLEMISRRALLLAPLALAACGFTPIYGRGSAAEALRGKIAFSAVNSRLTFEFNEELENRLGLTQTPLFQLDVTLSVTSKGLAIAQDNAITRYNLTGIAAFTLTRIADGEAVLQDRLRAFTAYSATANAYATFISERDANRRLAVSLADQITTRLTSSAESLGL
ncbi:MAG: LPS assembly lipoprotein LptE [Rhodobacteraceae bacterium]|nr:LPS assembly lipoprotein LptE [Paracoccaceae bacterium]